MSSSLSAKPTLDSRRRPREKPKQSIIRDCEDEDDEEPLPVGKGDTKGHQRGRKRTARSLDVESDKTLDLTEGEREKEAYLLPETTIYDTDRRVIDQLVCDWKARHQAKG